MFDSGGAIRSKIIANQQLKDELHKSIIKEFEKHKICSYFV